MSCILGLGIWGFCFGATAGAQAVGHLADVRIIRVGAFDGTDHAERFRYLVTKELSERGFIVTESESAETTLSGVLTVDAQDPSDGIRMDGVPTVTSRQWSFSSACNVALMNTNGVVLWKWEGTAGSNRFWDTIELEPIANLALKLVLKLDKDYRKAVNKKKGAKSRDSRAKQQEGPS